MHLIQPIIIDGTKYCLTENGGRTTLPLNTTLVSFPTDSAVLTNPSEWLFYIGGVASTFEVSFGASCLSEFNLSITNSTTSSDWVVLINIYLNGVLIPEYEDVLYDPLIDGGDIGVTFTDLPCGNLFTITVSQEMGDTEDLLTTIGFSI